MCNNSNIDLVNMNSYTKFGEIQSIGSEDIERKWNYHERNDGNTEWPTTEIQYSPPFSKRGYN